MDKTLIIVDMQEEFETADDYTTQQVIKQVLRAKEQGYPIIVLEYADSGHTHEEILDAIGDYHQFERATKYTDDGSNEVAQIAEARSFPKDFLICGVNYSFCVGDTADGLTEGWGYKVEIIEEACNCWPDSEWVCPGRLEFEYQY